MANEDRSSRLKTTAYELVKQYLLYDVNLRVTHTYTVHTDAVNGTPCTLTQYEYDGVSSRVVKRKESNATWNSAWDIT